MGKRRIGEAYLTVYLALIMTVMLSLCLALIEGVRSNAIRMETECVTYIGLDSILAEYHRELFRQYNLFGIDASYGTDVGGTELVQAHLQNYMDKNFSGRDVLLWNVWYRDFLATEVEELEVTGVSIMADNNGAVFRRNVARVAREKNELSRLREIWNWMEVVESKGLTEVGLDAGMESVNQQIQSYDGQEIQISETEWETVDVENPAKGLEQIRKQGLLKYVLKNESVLSTKAIHLENVISRRLAENMVNRGNLSQDELSETERMVERYYFQEYLLDYFGYFGKEKKEGALDYQVEYVLFGNDTDVANLKAMVNALCMIREGANALYLFGDSEKCAQAQAAATVATALIKMPQLIPLFKNAILLGWAYAESLYDVEVLLSGGKIPLLKDDASWHYSMEGALRLDEEDKKETAREGLDYADYLRLFLVMKQEDEITLRAMDMVECDIRLTEGNEKFRMDNCYHRVKCKIRVGSAYGYEYEITRERGYN